MQRRKDFGVLDSKRDIYITLPPSKAQGSSRKKGWEVDDYGKWGFLGVTGSGSHEDTESLDNMYETHASSSHINKPSTEEGGSHEPYP